MAPSTPSKTVFRTRYEAEIIQAQAGGSYVEGKNIQVRSVPLWSRWVLSNAQKWSLFGETKGTSSYGEYGSNLSQNASLPKGQSYVAQGLAFRFRNRLTVTSSGNAVPTTTAMLIAARRFLDDCIFNISRENDDKEVYFKGSLMRSTWGEIVNAGADFAATTAAGTIPNPALWGSEQEAVKSFYRFNVPLVFGQQVTFDFTINSEAAPGSALLAASGQSGYTGFDVFLLGARTKVVTA